jgi:putative transposase
MGLSLRLKRSKKRPSLVSGLAPVAKSPNERWSMDFVSDSLHDGRRFRALTIVDNFSRVSPAIFVGVSITGRRVAAVLDRLKIAHGLPQVITVACYKHFVKFPLAAFGGLGCPWGVRSV